MKYLIPYSIIAVLLAFIIFHLSDAENSIRENKFKITKLNEAIAQENFRYNLLADRVTHIEDALKEADLPAMRKEADYIHVEVDRIGMDQYNGLMMRVNSLDKKIDALNGKY